MQSAAAIGGSVNNQEDWRTMATFRIRIDETRSVSAVGHAGAGPMGEDKTGSRVVRFHQPRLIFVRTEHLPGFRIDQVQPRANRTRNSLISVIVLGRIVGDPALHVHARIRAAVNERRHPAP
jgi:hypothetical protein